MVRIHQYWLKVTSGSANHRMEGSWNKLYFNQTFHKTDPLELRGNYVPPEKTDNRGEGSKQTLTNLRKVLSKKKCLVQIQYNTTRKHPNADVQSHVLNCQHFMLYDASHFAVTSLIQHLPLHNKRS